MQLRTGPTLQELVLGLHYERMRELQVLGHRDAILWIVARTPRSGERRSQARLFSRMPQNELLAGFKSPAGLETCGMRRTRIIRAA
jgi:hypothetical protein